MPLHLCLHPHTNPAASGASSLVHRSVVRGQDGVVHVLPLGDEGDGDAVDAVPLIGGRVLEALVAEDVAQVPVVVPFMRARA